MDVVNYLIFRDYILPIIMASVFLIIAFIIWLADKISRIRKRNCQKCKYYQLYDAGLGQACKYKCTKHNRVDYIEDFNHREHYERCKDFKED